MLNWLNCAHQKSTVRRPKKDPPSPFPSSPVSWPKTKFGDWLHEKMAVGQKKGIHKNLSGRGKVDPSTCGPEGFSFLIAKCQRLARPKSSLPRAQKKWALRQQQIKAPFKHLSYLHKRKCLPGAEVSLFRTLHPSADASWEQSQTFARRDKQYFKPPRRKWKHLSSYFEEYL